jgi:hypothetical protein
MRDNLENPGTEPGTAWRAVLNNGDYPMDNFEARLARWEQEWVDGPREPKRRKEPEFEEECDGNDE